MGFWRGLLCDQWRSRRSGGLDRVPERIENGLIATTATEVVGLLRSGEVSSLDLLDALEHRIAAVDRAVGALPTLCIDRARGHAETLLSRKPCLQRYRGPRSTSYLTLRIASAFARKLTAP